MGFSFRQAGYTSEPNVVMFRDARNNLQIISALSTNTEGLAGLCWPRVPG